MSLGHTKLRIGYLVTAAALLCAASQAGCGATCKRVEQDRQAFLARPPRNQDTHVEVTVPFALIEGLITRQLDKIDAVALDVPGLGKLGAYVGELRLKVSRLRLLPAGKDRLGFELGFDVLAHGEKAFEVSVETEVKPDIDFASGRVDIRLPPESFESVKPRLSGDSAKRLGGIIYDRIPGLARALVSRDAMDKAAGSVVELLLRQFYAVSKDKILRRVSRMAELSFALPDVPVARLSIRSFGDDGQGAVQLLVTTSLPVTAGLAPVSKPKVKDKSEVEMRLSASTAAELVNWAMGKGLLASRFDKKGKPSQDGEYVAGVEWVKGERPMKIRLWQLEGSCKRIDLGARAAVSVREGKVKIDATDVVIEGSKAAPFTEAGLFFYALWKDAVDVTLSAKSTLRLTVAGRDVTTRVQRAFLENDQLSLGLSVQGGER